MFLKDGQRLMHEDVFAAVSAGDYQIHQDEQEIVMPAGAFLTPEAGMPGEGFFCDRSEHDEDEADGGELGEHPGSDAKASGNFGDSQEDGEAFAHPDVLGSLGSVFHVAGAAGDKDQADHEAHEEQGEIGEACELREHGGYLG